MSNWNKKKKKKTTNTRRNMFPKLQFQGYLNRSLLIPRCRLGEWAMDYLFHKPPRYVKEAQK